MPRENRPVKIPRNESLFVAVADVERVIPEDSEGQVAFEGSAGLVGTLPALSALHVERSLGRVSDALSVKNVGFERHGFHRIPL